MLKLDLTGKTVVITGASQGIGASISEVFANSGASLVLISRNENRLSALSKRLSAKYFAANVSNESDINKVFANIDKVDVLVNNAGIHFSSKVEDITFESMSNLFETNLTGAMFCSREAVKKMSQNKSGRIINISSTSGKLGKPFSSAYASSKAALIGFTQSLANEVARKQITVNAICPWMTETEMIEKIFSNAKYAEVKGLSFSNVKEEAVKLTPIKRFIQPEEVAHLALYLASDLASGITGQSISISGGPQLG